MQYKVEKWIKRTCFILIEGQLLHTRHTHTWNIIKYDYYLTSNLCVINNFYIDSFAKRKKIFYQIKFNVCGYILKYNSR